jgi:hypothetical protein
MGKGPNSTNLANKESDKCLFNRFIKEANFKNPDMLV